MPLVNLTAQEAKKIIAGQTTKLLRAKRSRPLKPGDTLKFLERQKNRKVKTAGIANCTTAEEICIYFDSTGSLTIQVDDDYVEEPEKIVFAKSAGFHNLEDLANKYLCDAEDYFIGQLIEWEKVIIP
jgi:hypothetical protein